MDQLQGLIRDAGQSLITQAGEQVKGYIGNAIQEFLFVKKDAPAKRALPSLKNMKILGDRGGLSSRPSGQDFYAIRDQCLQQGILFEDPEFPAQDSSLQFSKRMDRRIEWLRPSEMVEDPRFFFEGYSRFDVQQGELGDCWLLAAAANLTRDHKLFSRVVPDDQTFQDSYAGCFHFRFWQYGTWIDVVVDDRLPTYRGKLLYMHSTEENEFWSALLEKAYAKLHGSYEALKGGTTCEAMEDFTGGVIEMYELNEAPAHLFNILLKGYERSSMIACSIEPDPNELEAETPQGLIKGHAYSVTKVETMDIVTPNTAGKIQMLRLRNPWGNEAEWNGPWSDQSPEWQYIPEHVKQKVGLTFDQDGEFWMSYRDFIKFFDRVELCNLSPDSLSEEQIRKGKKKWEMSVFEGEWTAGVTAGGCRNFLDTFWHNPQYVITLTDPDEDDDEGLCTVIIALMQKNRRSKRNIGLDCLTIGFAVYSVTERDLVNKPLKRNFFQYNASVARSPAFINLREVSCRFKLAPGNYVIVPSTFDPNEEAEFLIRIFSESKSFMSENDQNVGFGEYDGNIHGNGMPDNQKYTNGVPGGPDPETAKLEQMFVDLAGPDGEIDWVELKVILDKCISDFFGAMPIVQSYGGLQQSFVPRQEAGGPGGAAGDDPASMIIGLICNALSSGIESLCSSKDSNPNARRRGDPENMEDQIITDQPGPHGPGPQPYAPQPYAPQPYAPQPDPPYGPPGGNNPYANLLPAEPAKQEFSKDVCRSMVTMMDFDQSGKMGIEEFRLLIIELKKWRDVFRYYDREQKGKLNAFELRDALNSAGYQINNRTLNTLAHRFGSREGMIAFDDFMMCAMKMKTILEKYEQHGQSEFSRDDYIERTLYT